ncbi:MAG: asparagine synthase (glutamine-hydrolyzing) [Acidobacteriota bacterium]
MRIRVEETWKSSCRFTTAVLSSSGPSPRGHVAWRGGFICGIAGELSWAGANCQFVEAMTSAVAHRGPDDRGFWRSPAGVVALGHARLSIVDLSPAGHQPMIDPHTGTSITFNGEIYNFQSLRRECEAAGDVFTSHSDTEVILALYRRHHVGFLQFLRGMFALAIWDEQRQELLLARDRVGKKPLNYALTRSGLAFCSELVPLSRHAEVDRGLDAEALELYLQCQFVPAPWSIYKGIRKLPPAHFAICDRHGLRLEKYWEVDYREKIEIGEIAAIDALEEKLTEAVRLRMIADVPLGALLSGGVDSSVVVAIMAKLDKSPVRTFSIGFEEEAYNELPFAREAADRYGTIHHPEIVRPEVESLLPLLARHYGEPYADSSAMPSFAVAAAARRHVTVALNGDGGDELLGGYPRYWLSEPSLVASRLFGGIIGPDRLPGLASKLVEASSIPGRGVRKILSQYVNPELRSILMYSAFWNDEDRRRLFPDGPASLLPAWREEWTGQAFAHAGNAVDRMLWLDNHTYLPGDLLAKMDIASMHCGLETRSPLLDHEVIEFCAKLPVKYKVRERVGKYLLKKLAERYFPRQFVHRRKMGFGIPLAAWLRGPLKNVMTETLGDPELMSPLSMKMIDGVLAEFAAGHGAHESRLWALLMYGYWRRQQSEAI